MADPKQKPEQDNEGEGNRSAARAYNRKQEEFVKEGMAGEAALAARRAAEEQGEDLAEAEKQGKARAAERDPEETRDYSKPD